MGSDLIDTIGCIHTDTVAMRAFTISQKFRKFLADRSANFTTLFALSAPLVLLSIGIAVDYSHAVTERQRMQAALDSAVLAGVETASASGQTAALTLASNYFTANIGGPSPTATFQFNSDGSLSGASSYTLPGLFGSSTGVGSLTLDVTAKALAIRLRRASQHLERAVRSNLAANGVDEFWEIEVLMSLLRATDHRRSAGELQRESQVTSGAITNRVGRLEQRGWVTREVDPSDRRQVLVSLTGEGLKQANHVVATKNESERQIFSGLDRAFLEQLATDLRTLLGSMEAPARDDA